MPRLFEDLEPVAVTEVNSRGRADRAAKPNSRSKAGSKPNSRSKAGV